MDFAAIPKKLYFKIGEVADLSKLKPYVLRYWETEFKQIAPAKSRTGQRLYKRKDVELILYVKELLHSQRYTIEGARKKVQEFMDGAPVAPVVEAIAQEEAIEVQSELQTIREELEAEHTARVAAQKAAEKAEFELKQFAEQVETDQAQASQLSKDSLEQIRGELLELLELTSGTTGSVSDDETVSVPEGRAVSTVAPPPH